MIPRLFTFVWNASYLPSETSNGIYINWQSESHPGLVGPKSRPCLREGSCAVSQRGEAGGPHYELQSHIKDPKAWVALFLKPEDGILSSGSLESFHSVAFHFPRPSINLVIWDRK